MKLRWPAITLSAMLTLSLALNGFLLFDNDLLPLPPDFNFRGPLAMHIFKVIRPLKYSGIESFIESNVTIQLDFENQMWRLNNSITFGKDGQVMLDENRFGTCGELASFTYQRIKEPLRRAGYQIQVLSAAESDYFPDNQVGSHFILKIFKPGETIDKAFFLDPSFKRYGNFESFGNYLLFDSFDPDEFSSQLTVSPEFGLGNGSPLLIRKNTVIFLTVRRQNDQFTSDNFSIGIYAVRKNHYMARPVFWIVRNNGQSIIGENLHLAETIIGDDQYQPLRQRIIRVFNRILIQHSNVPPGSPFLLAENAKATLNFAFK